MIVLWIFLGLLGLLFLLTLFSVTVFFSFEEEACLTIRYLFFCFPILPVKEEEKKEPPVKKQGPAKPVLAKKQEKKAPFKDILKEKGLKGFIKILQEAAKLLSTSLRKLARHIRVHVFSLEIAVSTDDAAETAIRYGKICSVVYPAASFLLSSTRSKEYTVDIRPDFDRDSSRIRAEAVLKIRVLFLLLIGISLFFKGLGLIKRHGIASYFTGNPNPGQPKKQTHSAEQ